MLKVDVDRVVMHGKDLIVLLRHEGEERVLPIHVDPGQAHAIELQLEGVTFPRPLTHDLFKNVLEAFNVRLLRAEIHDLVEGTFYARLVLSLDGRESLIDARPSDAIALAMRCSAAILVEDEVMNTAGVAVKLQPRAPAKPKAPESPTQQLEAQLRKAIEDERYEEAAELRDKLKRLKENKVHN